MSFRISWFPKDLGRRKATDGFVGKAFARVGSELIMGNAVSVFLVNEREMDATQLQILSVDLSFFRLSS